MALISKYAEEKQFLISANDITFKPKLYLYGLSRSGNGIVKLRDITENLNQYGSFVSRDGYQPLGARANFNLRRIEDLELRKNLLGLEVELHSEGDYIKRHMGVYIPKFPNFFVKSQISYSVECVDILSMLDTDMRNAFSTNVDEQASAAVRRAYSNSQCPLALVNPIIDYRFTDKLRETWLARDNITWLECINDMLRATGNVGIYSNRVGQLETRPYFFLDNTAPIWKFDSRSGVEPRSKVERNYWEIPNRWTGLADLTKFQEDRNQASYTVLNQSDGVTSYQSIGRWIDRVFKVDTYTREGLENSVRWQAQLDRQVSLKLGLKHYSNPYFWLGDVVEVHLPELTLENKIYRGVVASWRLPLSGDLMDIQVEVPI